MTDLVIKHITKETRALNDTLDQMDFTDIYRTLHPNATEYTVFSSAHGTFPRIDHILGHKSGLNRYQKIGIVPCIFSDHNALKLELNHKKKFGRNSNMWRLKAIVLKNERVNQEIREELKRFMETNENEDATIQIFGIQQKQSFFEIINLFLIGVQFANIQNNTQC